LVEGKAGVGAADAWWRKTKRAIRTMEIE